MENQYAQMVDLGFGEYITQVPSKRYPIYTRGNAGEVWPEVAYPLTITLTRKAGEIASAVAAINAGVITQKDIKDGPTCFGGVFAGYMYLNLSFGRMIAIRTPGTTIEKSDATYYGSEHEAPKYIPNKKDKSILASLKILKYGWRMLHTHDLPILQQDRTLVTQWQSRLPEILNSSDEKLVEAMREIMEPASLLFTHHLDITGQAGGAVQLLSTICEERLGDRSIALTLLGGLGDIDSAEPSYVLWELGRMVANDDALTAIFQTGLLDLELRLRESDSAQAFVKDFDDFLDTYGSRGANEWETACETWGTSPSSVLTLIDRMRIADPRNSPTVRTQKILEKREIALLDARENLKGFGSWLFEKALHSSMLFSQARERSKTTIIDLIHVARLITRELANRTARQRDGAELIDLWFILENELDDFINNPRTFNEKITERKRVRQELSNRVPPFIFEGEIPHPNLWPLRSESNIKPKSTVRNGETLKGFGGCPGIAEGIAKVITDPAEPRNLGPGDILIAPLTDPSWTPLFVPAEAVVVNVGGQMSHAVIVSRELGMPCVVAVKDATEIIEDGTRIRVNGATGEVVILETPKE